MPAQVSSLIEWFNANIAGSAIWSGLGLATAILAVLFAIYLLIRACAQLVTLVSTAMRIGQNGSKVVKPVLEFLERTRARRAG